MVTTKNADFEQTLENADTAARKLYRDEAKTIEDLRKGIIAASAKEDPYDIFICYKETDENGNRTLDSVLAQDIYDALTEKKYRVFFARITLEDKLGQEYEPYIFAALNSAKIMLAIGTDYEYYNAVWVKNEWSRYLKLMAEDHSKHLIPCYKGIDAYDIPKEFAKLQAQDLGKIGAIQDLLRGIDKLISPSAPAPTTTTAGAEIGLLLNMGNEALENGEWSIASNKFDLALTINPMCADAYLGKLLAECKFKKREQLAHVKKRLNKNAQYKQAIAYADDSLKLELEGYCKKASKRLWRNITIALVLFVCVPVLFACVLSAFFIKTESDYQRIISYYYSQAIDAETAYKKFSDLQWYKEPDMLTQFLLEGQCHGTYPAVADQTSFAIPNGVQEIAPGFFSNCTQLTDIIIPDSVTSIGAYAFTGCTGLTRVTIGNGLTSIGASVFKGCTSLTSITIPDSVTSIGASVFKGCTSLTSISIPNSVTSIGNNAFEGCTGLTRVTIGNGLTSIGASVFKGCTSLTSITIPDSVTSIGSYAFDDCTSLTSISIPNSVTSIGYYAFYFCDNLKKVYFSSYEQKEEFASCFSSDVQLIVQ